MLVLYYFLWKVILKTEVSSSKISHLAICYTSKALVFYSTKCSYIASITNGNTKICSS